MRLIFLWDDDPQESVKAAKRLLAAAEKKLSQQAGSASEETARVKQSVVATKSRADKLGTQSINVRTAADLL